MQAPKEILNIYQRFDQLPMENLTKAWYYTRTQGAKQRSVELMREHRAELGLSGNCFDLAIWLLDEFQREGLKAYGVGHHLHTEEAHVAVVVLDEKGRRYLCDLGDQWLQPILLDQYYPDFNPDPLPGFFPAALVQVVPGTEQCLIRYHRPNGKISQQSFELRPVELPELIAAGEVSQNTLGEPLVEMRVSHHQEIAHWEFYNFKSWLSTTQGLFHDPSAEDPVGWAERIEARTGMNVTVVQASLELYANLRRDT
jgi:hypothetical protein